MLSQNISNKLPVDTVRIPEDGGPLLYHGRRQNLQIHMLGVLSIVHHVGSVWINT